jgi:hypothetical protein
VQKCISKQCTMSFLHGSSSCCSKQVQ